MDNAGVTQCTIHELVCSHCAGRAAGTKDWFHATCDRCGELALQPTGRVLAYKPNEDCHTFIDPLQPLPPDVRRMEADWPR